MQRGRRRSSGGVDQPCNIVTSAQINEGKGKKLRSREEAESAGLLFQQRLVLLGVGQRCRGGVPLMGNFKETQLVLLVMGHDRERVYCSRKCAKCVLEINVSRLKAASRFGIVRP